MTPSTLAVRLTPKAASERIGEPRLLADGTQALSVYVTAVPEDNKANEAMLKLLAKHLGVAPSRLSILRGHTSRNKLVAIA